MTHRGSKDYEDPWDKNNVHADLFVAKLAKDVKVLVGW